MNNRLASRRLMALLIVIAGLWAYHNSFHGPFIFDDIPSISDNPYIRQLWPIGRAMFAPPGSPVEGRPVICLSLALNYALGGLNVWGYHAFNVTVHLLCALVLFGILRRTFEGEKLRDRFGTEAIWLAGGIALIWEVHPLQTESVTYIVQRAESLMSLFLLLTVYCVLRSSQSNRPRAWHWAAIVSCALGMGSKEGMVGAPLIVLLYDRVFLVSSFRELWLRRSRLYIGLVATWLILVVSVAMTFPREMAGYRIEDLTVWDYLKTEGGVLTYYLRLCFWPSPLIIDYSDWPIARSPGDYLVSGAVIMALLVGTVWAFRRRPWVGFLGVWFFLILAPTSSFLPILGEVAAERRMYLPLAAVVSLVVCGCWRLLANGTTNRRGARSIEAGAIMVLVAVVVTLGWLTVRRNEDYRTGVSIWSTVIAHWPHNTRALVNLGTVQIKSGLTNEALANYDEALRLDPNNSDAQFNLGLTLAGRNEWAAAEVHLKEAVRIVPHSATAQYDLGIVLAQQGDLAGAATHLAESVRFDAHNAEAHNSLGSVLARQGHIEKAEQEFNQAVQLRPDYAAAHANLGLALAQLGRLDEAAQHWETALRLDPNQLVARRALERIRSGGK